jgi:hypothetical protein
VIATHVGAGLKEAGWWVFAAIGDGAQEKSDERRVPPKGSAQVPALQVLKNEREI